MSTLEKAILKLEETEQTASGGNALGTIDARAKLIVTVAYLVAILSIPVSQPLRLLFFCVYPIIGAPLAGLSYGRVFKYSLGVLPLIAAVAIFNPFLDHRTAFCIGDVRVSYGWASFISIVVRGLLAVQAVLILIFSTGFNAVCQALRRLRVPAFFATLMQMIYRYLIVLLREAVNMDRARRSRGFGKRHYSLRMWATFVGQLLMRSIDRAERINRAMLARGFTGTMPYMGGSRFTVGSLTFTLGWVAFFVAAWLCSPEMIF